MMNLRGNIQCAATTMKITFIAFRKLSFPLVVFFLHKKKFNEKCIPMMWTTV